MSFEFLSVFNLYKNKKPLTVVKPGSQTRRFTHINDTIEICYKAWKQNLCRHYSISHKKSYSIIEVAKLFGKKIGQDFYECKITLPIILLFQKADNQEREKLKDIFSKSLRIFLSWIKTFGIASSIDLPFEFDSLLAFFVI